MAVVRLADFTARTTVIVQNALGGCINRIAQDTRFGIALGIGQELEAFAKRAELAQAVPTQVVGFHQLLNMLGGRTTRACLKQAAALHQFHDRQHLGRGRQFEDREEVGQVIAQHIARHRDRGFARTDRFKRGPRGRARRKDLELVGHALGLKDRLHISDQFGIMGARSVQPEDCFTIFCLLTVNCQSDPILDRGFARAGGTPDIARLNGMFMQDRPVFEDHFDDTIRDNLECGGVAAVFFGLLRHQTDILHRARGGGVQLACLFEILDRLVIDGRIGVIGDHAIGVMLGPVRAPAFAAGTDQGRHGGVDDHIRGHMQVGDATVAINHVKRWTLGHAGLDGRHDRGAVFDAGQQITKARIRVHAKGCHLIGIGFKDRCQIGFHGMAKDDRVRDLHHRGFHMQREQRAFGFGRLDLLGKESVKRLTRHEGCIHHGASRIADAVLQNRLGAVLGDMHDFGNRGRRQGRRDLVREEITTRHGGNAGFAIGNPFAHAMWVGLCKCFYRFGGAAVGIAFTQNRVHGRALDRIIFRARCFLGIARRGLGIIGDRIALALKLLNRSDKLRHRGRDIGQLDHIGLRCFDQITQLGQIIGLALLRRQAIGKGCKDTARKRDVLGADANACRFGKALNDRQKGSRGQFGGLVYFCVDDVGNVLGVHDIHALVNFCMP